ncbi:MAG: hypothetical protein EXR73_01805 [Myxococcales bacterium]|nr:hypothetical protein [Myxococcales bacterium]
MHRLLPGVTVAACACGGATKSATVAPHSAFPMRTYYKGLLRRGPAWTATKTPESAVIGAGQLAHLQRMAACGKLVLAGPFEVPDGAPADALAGIFVFDVATLDEAIALTRADPAVAAGRFTMNVEPWFGPVGLTCDGAEPPTPGARCTE